MYEDAMITTTSSPDAGPVVLVTNLIALLVVLVLIAALWKIFTKAGKPGWAAVVPIYNQIVLLEVVGRPVWWVVLMLIPFVNIVFSIIVTHDLSKSFGKGAGMTVLNVFLPFIGYPMLAWGDARYVGPVALGATRPVQSADNVGQFTQGQ